MSGAAQAPGERFPGFDVAAQARHWDPVTAGVVLARLQTPREARFFSSAEEAAAIALCDRLLGQDGDQADGDQADGDQADSDQEDSARKIPVATMIDTRLAEMQTDGWRYADMPEDPQAWRDTLRYLDEDAQDMCGRSFARCRPDDQRAIIQAVQDLSGKQWHGLDASHVWSLWTRYACTAFYAHPHVWNEIGFPGPAYPRGYKNPGVEAREPFEVADAIPARDPIREGY
ncbi:MAG TPA: gluconate 2-dehydrogenase subunit 3 family protein [Actinocrinis sp.]